MMTFPLLRSVLVAAVTVAPLLAQANAPQVRARDLLFAETPDSRHRAFLGEACISTLSDFYLRGGRLVSQGIQEKTVELKDVEDMKGSPAKNRIFYHYSGYEGWFDTLESKTKDRRKAHRRIRERGGYDSLLIHNRKDKWGLGMAEGSWYVAAEPHTSANYGNILLKLELSPQTRVVFERRKHDRKDRFLGERLVDMDDVREEMLAAYPEIFADCDFKKLHLFIYEDSGVQMVRYADTIHKTWFRLIRSESIVESNVYQMNACRGIAKLIPGLNGFLY